MISLIALVALSILTVSAARLYHAKETALGEEWYAAGEKQLRSGRTREAAADFRTALVYSRDNDVYQLRLAQALFAAGEVDEARAYLLNLWERRPESAPANLELGRLAVREGNVEKALRYFHNAIYGDWEGEDAAQQRREARLELYHFLMSKGAKSQAQAELMALTAELPADPHAHDQVAGLFSGAGDYDRALGEFRAALQADKDDQAALAGAGEAEFQMQNYRDARFYLERASKKDPDDARAAEMLETTKLVLSIDPFEPQLTAADRSARVVRAFDQVVRGLEDCAQMRGEMLGASAPNTALPRLYDRAVAMKPKIKERILARDPDLIAAAWELVGEAENLSASRCGPPTGVDEAILLATRKHGGFQK